MSVCQYLAAKVHNPTEPTDQPSSLQPVKSVTNSVKKPVKVSQQQQQQKPVAEAPPPPSPIVSQIMEMGFPRRHIEYAIQVRSSKLSQGCNIVVTVCDIFEVFITFLQSCDNTTLPIVIHVHDMLYTCSYYFSNLSHR